MPGLVQLVRLGVGLGTSSRVGLDGVQMLRHRQGLGKEGAVLRASWRWVKNRANSKILKKKYGQSIKKQPNRKKVTVMNMTGLTGGQVLSLGQR